MLKGRAKQLYSAGYKKIEDIAKAKAKDLTANLEHLPLRVANQLISAAKVFNELKLNVVFYLVIHTGLCIFAGSCAREIGKSTG